jgi:hypothetical protein
LSGLSIRHGPDEPPPPAPDRDAIIRTWAARRRILERLQRTRGTPDNKQMERTRIATVGSAVERRSLTPGCGPQMRFALTAVVITFGCAHVSTVDRRDPEGQRGFAIEKGGWADFRGASRVCIDGKDEDTGLQLADLIVGVVRTQKPAFLSECSEAISGLRVEYVSRYSACTHCPPPYRGPRFGFASIWRVEGGRHTSLASWVDTHGGTARQVAEYFAADLAVFLDDPERARRPQ